MANGRLKQDVSFWSLIALGASVTLLNLNLPIIRNAHCYAKAARGLLLTHFDVAAIVGNDAWTSGKPILFSLLAAPLVSVSDSNSGMIVASALGTLFYLWMAWSALERLNMRCGISHALLPIELAFVAFNPLVVYQFWSAYPDSLFAGFALMAFVLTDIIATSPERDTRWHILALAAAILLALHTKLYGAILAFTCPLYIALHWRGWAEEGRHVRSTIIMLLAVLAGIGLLLIAVKLRIYPWLRLESGAGVEGFKMGLTDPDRDISGAFVMMAFALLLNAQLSLLSVTRRAAWTALDLPPLLFVLIYLGGLVVFPGTDKNMRYFLPAFPFVAAALAAGFQQIRHKRTILAAFAICGALLIAIFNIGTAGRMALPRLARAARHYPELDLLLDNLRLPAQMAAKQHIDLINEHVPDGRTLYWISDYNGTSTFGAAHDLGVKPTIIVRYVMRPTQIPPSAEGAFVVHYTGNSFSALSPPRPGGTSFEKIADGLSRIRTSIR
jgi:hypothetical protein